MNLLKSILFFYSLNLVMVVAVPILFGAEFRYVLGSGRAYLLPLVITSIGLIIGLVIPFLLYEPNRKVILLWSQIVITIVFCSLIIKVTYDDVEAEREYQLRKNNPENVIRQYTIE